MQGFEGSNGDPPRWLNAESNMRIALLGEAPISSQTAVKRPLVLAELDGDGLSCSREGHSGSYHTVILCLTLHARCCHISAMQIVDVIKSTHCEKPDGFLRSRAPAPSAAFFLRHPRSLACTILRAE